MGWTSADDEAQRYDREQWAAIRTATRNLIRAKPRSIIIRPEDVEPLVTRFDAIVVTELADAVLEEKTRRGVA